MPPVPPLAVAMLTPAGRGAVAVVGVRGARATEVVDACFRRMNGRALTELPLECIAFGRWQADASSAGEEVVVVRRTADLVEVHCHGGWAAVEAILARLESQGAQRVDAAAWCALHETDALAAAARRAFAAARTTRTAALLAAQYNGALRDECRRITELVREGSREAAEGRLRTLLDRAPCGLHLTKPWRVILVGRPNAGKSSLINRVLGYHRAIVADEPGTTRDIVTASAAWDGWPLELADSAGVRETTDALEAAGVAQTHARRESADLTILVTDLTVPWSPEDQAFVDLLPAPLVAHNKIDVASPQARDRPSDGRPAGVLVSARTGEGIERLMASLVQCLLPDPPQTGDPLPFTPAIVDALRSAIGCLRRGDVAQALQQLAFEK